MIDRTNQQQQEFFRLNAVRLCRCAASRCGLSVVLFVVDDDDDGLRFSAFGHGKPASQGNVAGLQSPWRDCKVHVVTQQCMS